MEEYSKINMSLYDYIISHNEKVENRCAIDYFGRKYTFNEVKENINLVMKSLNELGLKKGDNVAILGLATPEFVFTMYALNKIGIILNVLNPLDSSSYSSIFERLNPKLVMCYDKFYPMIKDKIPDNKIVLTSPLDALPLPIKGLDRVKSLIKCDYPNIGKQCIRWDNFIKLGRQSSKLLELPVEYIKDEKIMELGTSGSTGIPKQVAISNEMLNNIIYQHVLMNKHNCFDVEFKDNEAFLDVIPPHLAYGICDIHLSMALRLKLCLEPDPNYKLFIKNLKKHKPVHVLAGPVHWKQLIAHKGRLDLSNLRNAISGGEHLENDDEIKANNKLKEYGSHTTVREGVGITEICGVGTYNSNGDLFTVGRPLPEYQVGIFRVDIDEEHNDNTKLSDQISKVFYTKNSIGELEISWIGNKGTNYRGEICYQLPVKVLGYIGEEHKEENDYLIRVHEDGLVWIHTGDIGYITEDNNLVITDRIKRVFNRNGWKIYPTYLSKIVSDSGLVKECTVVKRKSYNKSEAYVPILYVNLKEYNEENIDKLKTWCSKKITGNYRLYDIIFVDELPRTSAGKINFNLVEIFDSSQNPLAHSETLTPSENKNVKKLTLARMHEVTIRQN